MAATRRGTRYTGVHTTATLLFLSRIEDNGSFMGGGRWGQGRPPATAVSRVTMLQSGRQHCPQSLEIDDVSVSVCLCLRVSVSLLPSAVDFCSRCTRRWLASERRRLRRWRTALALAMSASDGGVWLKERGQRRQWSGIGGGGGGARDTKRPTAGQSRRFHIIRKRFLWTSTINTALPKTKTTTTTKAGGRRRRSSS